MKVGLRDTVADHRVPRTPTELLSLETLHRVFDVYLWLAQHFPLCFVDAEAAKFEAKSCAHLVDVALRSFDRRPVTSTTTSTSTSTSTSSSDSDNGGGGRRDRGEERRDGAVGRAARGDRWETNHKAARDEGSDREGHDDRGSSRRGGGGERERKSKALKRRIDMSLSSAKSTLI